MYEHIAGHIDILIIYVFLLITIGDDNKPRSWSKYAPDSTAYKKEHPKLEEVIIQTEPNTKKKKSKLKSEVEEKLKQVIIYPINKIDKQY